MTTKGKYLAGLVLGCCLGAPAYAGVIGDIKVCYNCSNNFGSLGVLDGPTFLIENTSLTAITGILFTAAGDTYHVGTIGAGSNVILEPGVSNDGGVHSGFWTVLGGILDTSDSGPDLNTTQFSLTGLQGATSVVSNDLCTVNGSIFTPLCTAGPSNDNTVSDMNFLGFDDPACNNCFGPKQVASLVTVTQSSVPEPSTWMLVASAALAGVTLRRRAKKRG